jgi:hypothetical protein
LLEPTYLALVVIDLVCAGFLNNFNLGVAHLISDLSLDFLFLAYYFALLPPVFNLLPESLRLALEDIVLDFCILAPILPLLQLQLVGVVLCALQVANRGV